MRYLSRTRQNGLCKRKAVTFCYHCRQEVCHSHFVQHSAMVMADIYSLVDQIDSLTNSITKFSIVQPHDKLFDQSQQWPNENINLIENTHRQKQVELDAKIHQLHALLSLVKAENQQEISEITREINKLIDAREATFDQMNCLRKSVNGITFDIDKIRTPTYLDTCRSIFMGQVPNIKLRDVSTSNINDDVRHFNQPADQFHFSTNQSMGRVENNRLHSSSPTSGSLITSHPSHIQSEVPILYSNIDGSPFMQMPYLAHEPSFHTFMEQYPPSDSSYIAQLHVYTR